MTHLEEIEESLNEILQAFNNDGKIEIGHISDGYHTFDELYDHRCVLFIVLCNFLYRTYAKLEFTNAHLIPWKTRFHADGTQWDGWFLAGLGQEKGKQISYHLPIKYWDKLRVVAYDKAPTEWDGHTPADVIERLLDLL